MHNTAYYKMRSNNLSSQTFQHPKSSQNSWGDPELYRTKRELPRYFPKIPCCMSTNQICLESHSLLSDIHSTPDRPVNPIQSWFQLSFLRWLCWGVYVGYLGKCASVNISLIFVTQGQCLWDTLEEAPRLCKSLLATLTRDSFQTQEQWWPRQIPPMASSPWDSTLWRCGRILEGDMTGLLGQGEGQRDEEGEG